MNALTEPPGSPSYRLDEQVGFLLRQASQRHATLFAARLGDITPTQWAALSKLHEVGPTSQNLLGRLTAMDAATIKGVADRLMKRGFVRSEADDADARRRLLALTAAGRAFAETNYRGRACDQQGYARAPDRTGAIAFHGSAREADLEAGLPLSRRPGALNCGLPCGRRPVSFVHKR